MDDGYKIKMEVLSIIDHTLSINLKGVIYIEHSAQIKETIIRHINDGNFKIIMDFSDVTYIDSAGIGMLITLRKLSQEKGGYVKVKNLNGMVKNIFQLTMVEKLFI